MSPAARPAGVVRSATGLILVAGFPSPANAEVARWGEDVARGIEHHLAVGSGHFRGQPIQILARRQTQYPRGRVVKAQGWVDGMLTQKLYVVNPEQTEQEDMLEGLCWLLLNRHLIARQSPQERIERLGEAPDWLAVGLAQQLYPELRARNADRVLDRWHRGESFTLDQLLDMAYLPAGRWHDKYVCGLFIGWLHGQPEHAARMARMLDRLARHERLTAEWLASQMPGFADTAQAESAWQDWVLGQAAVARDWGSTSAADTGALRGLLEVSPQETATGKEPALERTLTARDLIVHRGASWLPAVLTQRLVELERLGFGKAPEFRRVVAGFQTYFAGLSPRGSTAPALSDDELRRQFEQAEASLRDLENQLRHWGDFLDRAEAELDASQDESRAPAEALLDRVEQGGDSENQGLGKRRTLNIEHRMMN